jgi:ribonuclease P protein component
MLPRVSRLKRSRDFQAVYKRRTSWASPHLVLYVRFRTPREGEVSRLGFVISKKIAKRAHDRNRLKRRLREISRHFLLTSALRPFDALVVARTAAPAVSFEQLTQELTELSRRGGLLKEVQYKET